MASHGEGIYLYDESGKRYIDGSGGALVVNIGHGQKEILQGMTEQMGRLGYVHGTQFTTKAMEEYARALAEVLPKGLEKIYFLSGGSESIEAAIKLARQYFLESGQSQRWRVVARWHSYHGNTLGALSLTGRIGMRRPYLPLLIDFPHFPPPYCYRCPFGLAYPECELECSKALENVILMEGPETISAVILEPVIGATVGAVVPPNGYLSSIRKICDHYGILLIDDEVMTGMGRTGRWFAVEHWGVTPDIMVLGKGMSGGYFPLSAMITRGEFVDRLKRHPLARAMRIDKVRLAGLAATLTHYLKGEALGEIPVWRMISAPLEEIDERARLWAQSLGGLARVVEGETMVGGGSLPGGALPTRLVAVAGGKGKHRNVVEVLSQRLRRRETPVVGRISDEALLLDPRSVLPEEDELVLKALQDAAVGLEHC